MNIENLSKDDSLKMIEKGMTFPLLISVSTLSDLTVSTGRINDQNTFPIIFRFNDVKKTGTINGKEMPGGSTAFTGSSINATSTQTNDLHLDSILGKSLDTSMQKELTGLFNTMENELHLPANTIKVGDTFTQELPINMPMNDANIAIKVTATYKLISIKKGLAKFDIDQSSHLSMSNIENSKTLTGKGGVAGK